MKRLYTITLAAAILGSAAANVAAEEVGFIAPDIHAKLDNMVEAKMNELVRQTHDFRNYLHVAETVNNVKPLLPCINENVNGYDSEETRS